VQTRLQADRTVQAKPVRFVALLRGVNNAGKSARVAMADLRRLFQGLGFQEVSTLLNSGNVVFSSATRRRGEILARIKEALASRLGLTVPVAVLSAGEIATAVHDNPFARRATNPSRLLVVVPLAPSGMKRLRPLQMERWTPEALGFGTRAAYLWCARGVAKSPLWAAVERALGREGTARNIATMTRLLALAERRVKP
jgi:uncharacterized protein (DUF1697 family)